MDKSIYSKDYGVFLQHLRQAREQSGLTQIELARRLSTTQSFVSKCERGKVARQPAKPRSGRSNVAPGFNPGEANAPQYAGPPLVPSGTSGRTGSDSRTTKILFAVRANGFHSVIRYSTRCRIVDFGLLIA